MTYTISTMALTWLLVLAVWELAWKGIALWRAARNEHTVWFVLMLVLNTAGILPIIYVLWQSGRNDKRRLAKPDRA